MNASEASLSLPRRWLVFTQERFHPLSHIPMILLFFISHVMVAKDFGLAPFSWPRTIGLFAAVMVFFFKLRLYDEIKDYPNDQILNPNRPLPRGLLTIGQVKKAIVVAIVAEILLFSISGFKATLSFVLAVSYSLLMYKEFFIPALIRPHLTTYAVTHTVVMVLLTLAILSGLEGVFCAGLYAQALFFALSSWALFNVFEFGRKTFQSDEERKGVPTYSNIFGRYGAILLVFSQSCIAALCLSKLAPGSIYYQGALAALLLIAGMLYAFLNRRPWGKIYRTLTSLHIILAYAGVLAMFLI